MTADRVADEPMKIPVTIRPKANARKHWRRQIAISVMWWCLSLALFIGIWELVTALGWTNTLILPPPHEFFAEIKNQEQFLAPQIGVTRTGGNFVLLTAVVATLKRVMAGIVLGFIAALGVGGLACYFDLFGKLTLPVITLLAPIAPIAWIPFAIMAFGIGDGAAIFVVFIGIFFLLTLATVNAVNNVDQLYINTARVLGATRRQVMFKVVLPAVIPDLFFILRINFFAAWMAVLAAEMVGVNTGLGAIVMVGRQMFNAKLMFLGMAVIGVVGYLLDVVFRQLQRRVLWWKGSSQI
ncbi:ABC transporter, permease protein [Synechococcus sp. PCC 7335]|uniref:ABC transporter permease n=1 Tax=Synechococcus sp. (strain ATCC 29403 / PCC 7335) TaxID=91464 RepID=UPI00017ECB31|nr:ABC transporter permease [Synechococcus sp. PCC 7335]EDX85897.1 ABC transporter, permease protein [Synechococcus sp. PCC 7335]